MSYTPTIWSTDDVITAEKLNNIENGIAGAGGLFIIHATGVAHPLNPQTQPTFDKTYAEVSSAFNSGLIPTVVFSTDSATLQAMFASYSDQGAFLFANSVEGFSESRWSITRTDIMLGDNGMSMSMWSEVFLTPTT